MKRKKASKGPLTPAEIKQFQALLLSRRSEILGDVSTMENETLHKNRSDLSNVPLHMADLGTDNYEQEFTLGLMDGERKVLKEIDDALQRIEEGIYGICQAKGEPISKQRLEAIPWARYCVSCAELLEKGLLNAEEFSDESDYGQQQDEGPDGSSDTR